MRILPCSCKNDFQDARYGKGNRAHTIGRDGSKRSQYGKHTCTVCGKRK